MVSEGWHDVSAYCSANLVKLDQGFCQSERRPPGSPPFLGRWHGFVGWSSNSVWKRLVRHFLDNYHLVGECGTGRVVRVVFLEEGNVTDTLELLEVVFSSRAGLVGAAYELSWEWIHGFVSGCLMASRNSSIECTIAADAPSFLSQAMVAACAGVGFE